MSEQIKKKLTSRKFWIAVAGFITAILVAWNVDDNSIGQVTAIIMGFADIIVYVFAESYVDGQHIGENNVND